MKIKTIKKKIFLFFNIVMVFTTFFKGEKTVITQMRIEIENKFTDFAWFENLSIYSRYLTSGPPEGNGDALTKQSHHILAYHKGLSILKKYHGESMGLHEFFHLSAIISCIYENCNFFRKSVQRHLKVFVSKQEFQIYKGLDSTDRNHCANPLQASFLET